MRTRTHTQQTERTRPASNCPSSHFLHWAANVTGKLVGEGFRVEEALVGVAEGVSSGGVWECGVGWRGIGVDGVVGGRFEDVLGQHGQWRRV